MVLNLVCAVAPYYQLLNLVLVMALVASSNYALPEVTVSLLTYIYLYKHYFQKEAHTFIIIHEMVK